MGVFLVGLIIYQFVLFGIAYIGWSRVSNESDFLVGGRKFNLWLSSFCLFSTWFGAGTLIASTDEVSREGLRVTALEPFGAGVCLILAGIFIARPLWKMNIFTYGDFFRKKFGPKVEFISVILNVPIYVGWIAVQYIVLAEILQLYIDVSPGLLIFFICCVTLVLALVGGLWSVSLTDSFQSIIIILGLVYLFFKVLSLSPLGLEGLFANVPENHLDFIPAGQPVLLMKWVSLFSIAALGNLTGQDLAQRIFAARSPSIAVKSCIIAGVAYICVGLIPVFLGLTAQSFLGSTDRSVIPQLIKKLLDPYSSAILTLTILSAIVSTITSALIAPASLISNNFLKKHMPQFDVLKLSRLSVIFIALLSLFAALAGEDVYSILESSYAVGFVAFFVPVVMGLTQKKSNEVACLWTLFFCVVFWVLKFITDIDLPFSLIAVGFGFPLYFIFSFFFKERGIYNPEK